jgi:hypothetical protein
LSDKTLTDYLTGGWAGLNSDAATQAANTENAHEQWLMASRIAKPFIGREGQEALQLLAERTTENTTWDPDLGPNAVNNGFFREGQNSIVRFIRQCIAKAQEGPPGDPGKAAPPRKPRKRA